MATRHTPITIGLGICGLGPSISVEEKFSVALPEQLFFANIKAIPPTVVPCGELLRCLGVVHLSIDNFFHNNLISLQFFIEMYWSCFPRAPTGFAGMSPACSVW